MNLSNLSIFVVLLGVLFLGRISAQESAKPSCDMCRVDYVPVEELDKYVEAGRTVRPGDMQVRSIDVGAANIQVAMVHRDQLQERAGRVAVHNLVSEVYYVIAGSGTVLTGPDLVNPVDRSADSYSVRMLNGPGQTAEDVRDGDVHELVAGDVLVIPAGTGHEFIAIPEFITYLTIRVDPDQVVPLMNSEDSAAFLRERLGL